MSKRNVFGDENPNRDFCEFLTELSDYEKNVTNQMYKYAAYKQAALTLAAYPTRIKSGKEAKTLKTIGPSIAKKIDEYLKHGKVRKLQEIRKDDRAIAMKLLTRVSGIGPVKAKKLFDQGFRTLDDLKDNADVLSHHQLVGLKHLEDFEKRIPRSEIAELEKLIKEKLLKFDSKYIVTICGSYRRGKETCGDIDCLLTHPDFTSENDTKNTECNLLKGVVEHLENCKIITDTLTLGNLKFMGVCRLSEDKPARRLDMRLAYYDQYYCCVLYFTGSDMFNKNMRIHALEKGFTLNEYTLRPVSRRGVIGKPVPITSEEQIFEYIDYPYKQPYERDL